jgi:hypothetical protein
VVIKMIIIFFYYKSIALLYLTSVTPVPTK